MSASTMPEVYAAINQGNNGFAPRSAAVMAAIGALFGRTVRSELLEFTTLHARRTR